MWIDRKYETTVAAVFKQFPVLVLTGARQVGKTSLVRRVFAEAEYLSLDIPSLAAQAENSPTALLANRREPVIIDEIQYAPALLRHLKVLVDQDKRPGRFVLTGSQNFELMQAAAESLAGRCAVIPMANLCYGELSGQGQACSPEDFVFRGGFPELYQRPGIEGHLWHAAYLATYLERDVRNILNVGSLRDFDRFLRAAALRTGQILSYSELARDVGIAPNTAKNWISVLQASGQIHLLEPYHRNLGKRLIKAPKLYFADSGLAAFLMGFESAAQLWRHPVAGALWQTFVVMEVVKHFQALGRRPALWYWRTVNGAEVDLLIEQAGRFTAIECKLQENPGPVTLKGFDSLKRFYGSDCLIAGLVACRTAHPFVLGTGAQAVNGGQIALFLGV